jgi:plastocyanin
MWLFLATAGVAGELAGAFRIVAESGAAPTTKLDPYAGTLNSASASHDVAPRRTVVNDIVIYLRGVTADAAPPARRAAPRLAQINQSFEPHVLGVPVGTTVEFPNMDMVYHNVFSYSKTKRFDLGYYGKGKSKRVTFDKPGIVQVFCDIHSTMSAYVLVVDTPFVTQPDDDGTYSFSDLPSGTYTLTVWHPDLGERTLNVTVDDGPTRLDVNL